MDRLRSRELIDEFRTCLEPIIKLHGFHRRARLEWRRPCGWGDHYLNIPLAWATAGYLSTDVVIGFYDPIIHSAKFPDDPAFKNSMTYGTTLRTLKEPGTLWKGNYDFHDIGDVAHQLSEIKADLEQYVWTYFDRYPTRRSILDSLVEGRTNGDVPDNAKDGPILSFYLKGMEDDPAQALAEAKQWRIDRQALFESLGERIRPALFVEIDRAIAFLEERCRLSAGA